MANVSAIERSLQQTCCLNTPTAIRQRRESIQKCTSIDLTTTYLVTMSVMTLKSLFDAATVSSNPLSSHNKYYIVNMNGPSFTNVRICCFSLSCVKSQLNIKVVDIQRLPEVATEEFFHNSMNQLIEQIIQ